MVLRLLTNSRCSAIYALGLAYEVHRKGAASKPGHFGPGFVFWSRLRLHKIEAAIFYSKMRNITFVKDAVDQLAVIH